MKSNFEIWLQGCKINNSEVWCLEGDGDSGLYKVFKRYFVGNREYNETPVYIGWVNGKQVVAVTNYRQAYTVWHNRMVELENLENMGGAA